MDLHSGKWKRKSNAPPLSGYAEVATQKWLRRSGYSEVATQENISMTIAIWVNPRARLIPDTSR